MRAVTCFLYVVSIIVYYRFMPSTRFAFGFNIVTQLLFTAIICIYATLNGKANKRDKLLLYYVAALSVGRAVYTSFCVYKDKEWVLYYTDVFVFIMCVTFGLFLISLALIEK